MVDQGFSQHHSLLPDSLRRRAPGVGLSLVIAAVAFGLQRASGIAALSPLVLAMVLGILFRTIIGKPAGTHEGIAFTLRPILRSAIVMLGFQITLTEVAGLGWSVSFAVIATLVATLIFAKTVGRWLGVDAKLAELIGAGSAICGASAIIACNTVTRGSDEDVAYAMACVTLFGTAAMLLSPIVAGLIGLSPDIYGLWVGTSIHEVAQVIGAAFALGDQAGHAGTVAKLGRVMMLAPVILALGAMARRGAQDAAAKVPVPWFAFGFVGVMLLNSVVSLPQPAQHAVVTLTSFLMTMALAAMGLETDLRRLRLKGMRPLLLGALSWLFIAGFGLMAVLLAV